MRPTSLRVFCDFDGTACQTDVGNEFFRRFSRGASAEVVEQYRAGDISGAECLIREAELVSHVEREIADRFASEFQLDTSFVEFVRFCERRAVPITVLSDGLDFYIRRLLQRAGVQNIPFYANSAQFSDNGSDVKFSVTLPYYDVECVRCANCKCNHVLTRSADEDVIVYIGNGRSDGCPVRYADIVFAKQSLVSMCQRQNITYHEFSTFHDIISTMERLLTRKRLKHRWEAVTARKNAFIAE